MVEKLLKLKPAVEQTIVFFYWTTFVNSLCGNHHQKLFTKARVIRTNVRMNKLWDTCVNFVHMMEPVLMSLKAFDGKQPCMGKAWDFMKTMEQHVLSL
jgi:hypothetical protein